MRPIADNAVASMVYMPAFDCRSWPPCTICQSVAQPSTAEYWHMGDTTMRLARVSSRRVRGENRVVDMVMLWVTDCRGVGRAPLSLSRSFPEASSRPAAIRAGMLGPDLVGCPRFELRHCLRWQLRRVLLQTGSAAVCLLY